MPRRRRLHHGAQQVRCGLVDVHMLLAFGVRVYRRFALPPITLLRVVWRDWLK
jgi:hypothetical protein